MKTWIAAALAGAVIGSAVAYAAISPRVMSRGEIDQMVRQQVDQEMQAQNQEHAISQLILSMSSTDQNVRELRDSVARLVAEQNSSPH